MTDLEDEGRPLISGDPPPLDDDAKAADDTTTPKAGSASGSDSAAPPPTTSVGLLNEALDGLGFGTHQWRILFLCGFADFMDALEMVSLSLLFPILKKDWKLDHHQIAAIESFSSVGQLIGCVAFGILADRYGRKSNLVASLGLLVLFGFLSAAAPNLGWFLIFRVGLGLAYGGNVVTSMTLLSESLPTNRRGMAIVSMEIFFGVGSILGVGLAWLLIPRIGWRWYSAILSAGAIPVLIGLFFAEESPRFQLARRQYDKVAKTIAVAARVNGKTDAERAAWSMRFAAERFAELDAREVGPSRDDRQGRQLSFFDQFRKLVETKSERNSFLLLTAIWFLQAFGTQILKVRYDTYSSRMNMKERPRRRTRHIVQLELG